MVNTMPAQGGGGGGGVLLLASLNHISLVCRSLESSLSFYRNVLGFTQVRRPGSLDFAGAWLFNYGVGIHLLQAEDSESAPAAEKKTEINPRDNHISFTCKSMQAVRRRLKEMGIRYVQRRVVEEEEEGGGVHVDQLFFHDPDGYMIEVCTCDNLPVVPLLAPAAPDVVDAKTTVGGRRRRRSVYRRRRPTAAAVAVPPAEMPDARSASTCACSEASPELTARAGQKLEEMLIKNN